MQSYLLSILAAITLLIAGFFLLRFIFRVLLDVVDLAAFMLTVHKNESEYKKYKEEKAKNLERENELRLKKLQAKQEIISEQEEMELYEGEERSEQKARKFFWRDRISKERSGLINMIKRLLTERGLGDVTPGDHLPIWQIKIRAERESGQQRDRGPRH